MKKRFIIYGLIGWCMEIFWTGFQSLFKKDVTLVGQTSWWMFPIYGLAVFLEPICDRLKQRSVIIRGGVYTVCIFAVEYITGWLLKKVLGVCPWDYSKSKYNVKGLIRLDYAPAWFAAGLIYEKLHEVLMGIKLPRKIINRI